MGTKYAIKGWIIGTCPFNRAKLTNNLIVAIFYFIVFNAKYKIVDFNVRRGYSDPIKCKENCHHICMPHRPQQA